MLPSSRDRLDRPTDSRHDMTRGTQARGPSFRALVILSLSALALLATSPGQPTLEGRAFSEVVIDSGETVERELRIHVDPEAGLADSGTISPALQAASGLQPGYSFDASIELVGAGEPTGAYSPNTAFPIERCTEGCDLSYQVRISAGPTCCLRPSSDTRSMSICATTTAVSHPQAPWTSSSMAPLERPWRPSGRSSSGCSR